MQKVFLFNEKLSINLIDDFLHVSDEKASEMFPLQDKPQVIFADTDFSRFLTLSLLEKALGTEETLNAAREIRKLIWNMYPSSILKKEAPMKFGNMKCSGFSFRTDVDDKQKFNTMFVVSFEGKLLLGTFGCAADDDDAKKLLAGLLAEAKYRRTLL